MSIKLQNSIIIASGPDGDFAPNAEEIYAAVFEPDVTSKSTRLDRKGLLRLGVRFSDTPASPTLLISAEISDSKEPRIRCKLAGKVGSTVAHAPADYVIIDQTWYPLPHNT